MDLSSGVGEMALTGQLVQAVAAAAVLAPQPQVTMQTLTLLARVVQVIHLPEMADRAVAIMATATRVKTTAEVGVAVQVRIAAMPNLAALAPQATPESLTCTP